MGGGMGQVRRYWKSRLAGLALMGLAPGCREELGPVRFPTTRVTGVVREGERPVGGGWIEFLPVDGTVGNLRSAPLRPDGSFEADRVAVGTNQVGLVAAPVGSLLAQRFHPMRSPIRRAIPAGPSTTLTIDLIEEAVHHQPAPPSNP
jgi:hypothetical protein